MKLPLLPPPDYTSLDGMQRRRTNDQVRMIQREAAIWAIEEAAKVCEGKIGLSAETCADAILALKEQIDD
jgi:hypothetical protein